MPAAADLESERHDFCKEREQFELPPRIRIMILERFAEMIRFFGPADAKTHGCGREQRELRCDEGS